MQTKYLDQEELRAFFKSVQKGGSKRDIAMFTLSYLYGLRTSEMVNMKFEDLHLDAKKIHITRSKHGVPGVYELETDTMRLLRAYMRARKKLKHAATSPYLFLSNRSQDRPMSRWNVLKLFQKYLKQSGNQRKLGVHSLRHSTGAVLAMETGNEDGIAVRLGHRSVRSTKRYMQLGSKEEMKRQREFNKLLKL